MNDVEVEAVDAIDLPVGVEAPEYVLYGGKGGVGKTTMAAATALASAEDGTPTLVISTDPAHSLSDTFEREVPADPTQLFEDRPLWAAEIDPDAAMDELGGIAGMLGGNNPLGELLGGGAMPGADEAVAMQQLLTFMEDDRFDRVVVDTAPTGHTLRLLELPEMMDTLLGRLVEWRERFGNMLEGMGGLFGGEDPEEGQPPGLHELREQIERLRAVLRDPARTDFRLVMVPETMSVDESSRLLERLDGAGIPVQTIVVNRVMEDPADVAGIEEPWIVAPDLESCGFCRRRWEVQREALEAAFDVFRGKAIKRVPLFPDDVRGHMMLQAVARCLD